MIIHAEPVLLTLSAGPGLPPIQLHVWPDPRAAPDDSQRVLSVLALAIHNLQASLQQATTQIASLAILAAAQLRDEPLPSAPPADPFVAVLQSSAIPRGELAARVVAALADATVLQPAPADALPE